MNGNRAAVDFIAGMVRGMQKGREQRRQQEMQKVVTDLILPMTTGDVPQKSGAYVGGIDLKTGIPNIKVMSPKEQYELQLMRRMTGAGGQPGVTPSEEFKTKSIKVGPYTFEKQPTEQERQQAIQQKAQEQAVVGAEKERQLNLSKVKRLKTIADTIETEWIKTSPSRGFLGRLSGLGSIPASTLQITEQQQIDSAYRTFVKGMRAQLARAMGDVGNLSEPEQKAAMELVPGLGDNYETGIRKIELIRAFVNAIESGNAEQARKMLNENTSLSQQPNQQQSGDDPLGIR
jgi:hypothetical protein